MKVLVANRGEIAVRIVRACRIEGLETVAVYSDVDRASLHVRMANEAICLGPPAPRESYLHIGKIIDAAKRTGADAIHPGYGFLSENADFAQAVEDAGLVFIGPTAAQIRTMGDKISARRTVSAAGVPVVPGTTDPLADPAAAARFAAETGYPVMLKAVAGGGGKGIRIVKDPAEIEAAFARASSEALHAFGNPALYVEKYLENPRHIEIQILADTHGNTTHYGERECSIQRRHQKIIEETPSAFVDEEMRQKMGATAVSAAKAIGYRNAGTVEFLVDRDRNFFFLEMNTRLQVEHPVTEMVYRADLVREQLRIAQGQRVNRLQHEIRRMGHAIEARIYAEDPQTNFLPSPGRIDHLELPGGPGVRLDHGLFEGIEIPLHYDPMLGKLIAFGNSRESALRRLKQALREFSVTGIKTIIPFLMRVLDHPRFVAGDFDTSFLDRHMADLRDEGAGRFREAAAIAAALYEEERAKARRPRAAEPAGGGPDPWVAAGRREAMGQGGGR
ncbi:MAG: acetyl-CoA carboxylase biotin carboxylase subunit [Planctomycetes bacterium]|jgi:acetyl-CoA carboxylase biotin carboxylase subunit|nr:acetyl-CoA carboxylase biotin carboxylase subunit [Planctomycetota bacterium]